MKIKGKIGAVDYGISVKMILRVDVCAIALVKGDDGIRDDKSVVRTRVTGELPRVTFEAVEARQLKACVVGHVGGCASIVPVRGVHTRYF